MSRFVFVKLNAALMGCAVALCFGVLGGCGGQRGPDPQAQTANVEQAKTMRTYFDKAQGDYAKLSEEDKAAFVKLAGDEAKATQYWELMKNGPIRPESANP